MDSNVIVVKEMVRSVEIQDTVMIIIYCVCMIHNLAAVQQNVRF